MHHTFHMCALIDPADFPLPTPSTASPRGPVLGPSKIVPSIRTVHWLDSQQVEKAIAAAEAREGHGKSGNRAGDGLGRKAQTGKKGRSETAKLRDALRDYEDLVFCVEGDGSMIVWGIQVRQ